MEMNVVFRFQDESEIVNDGVSALEANADDKKKVAHKDKGKKNGKALFLIHHCVDHNVFEKIIEEEMDKNVWDKLKSLYDEDEKLKRMKLQTLRKKFEMTHMKVDELVSEYRSHVVLLMNKMKAPQARFTKKSGKEKAKQGNNLASDEKLSKNSKNHPESSKKGMGNQYFGKKVDMKEVQCYNCQEFGHYAQDCRRNKEARAKDIDEAQFAHAGNDDSNDVLLMTNTQSNTMEIHMWYLDLGCNNYMTSNKIWFTKLDESVKKVVDTSHQVEKETYL
ncbi:uncharacterized protein LOC131650109 [Vicia villosa]|uniref:uncharacterized protein LOC131650109 n=1 Tax=Vicia villosa TaxID=3911 RepID=UPI00273B3213|nr:uncharacterized protein LOC131650109 [Vicia villosa]